MARAGVRRDWCELKLETNGGQNQQNLVGTLKNFDFYSEGDGQALEDSNQRMTRSDLLLTTMFSTVDRAQKWKPEDQ